MFEYRCTVGKVVDGDTLRLVIDLGCDVTTRMTVRLAGVDTPELGTVDGATAKTLATEWVSQATGLTLATLKDKREKYGRYLGVLMRTGDDESLNSYLLRVGYATPYTGGSR